jgi:hypothetical protein
MESAPAMFTLREQGLTVTEALRQKQNLESVL